VDQLPENQAELAHAWLLDLRDAPMRTGPPFGQEALALWIVSRGSCGGSCETSRRIRARTRPVNFRVSAVHEAEKILDRLDRRPNSVFGHALCNLLPTPSIRAYLLRSPTGPNPKVPRLAAGAVLFTVDREDQGDLYPSLSIPVVRFTGTLNVCVDQPTRPSGIETRLSSAPATVISRG